MHNGTAPTTPSLPVDTAPYSRTRRTYNTTYSLGLSTCGRAFAPGCKARTRTETTFVLRWASLSSPTTFVCAVLAVGSIEDSSFHRSSVCPRPAVLWYDGIIRHAHGQQRRGLAHQRAHTHTALVSVPAVNVCLSKNARLLGLQSAGQTRTGMMRPAGSSFWAFPFLAALLEEHLRLVEIYPQLIPLALGARLVLLQASWFANPLASMRHSFARHARQCCLCPQDKRLSHSRTPCLVQPSGIGTTIHQRGPESSAL